MEKTKDPYLDVLRFHENYCHSSFTQNNSVGVFTEGQDKFKSLFADIKEAKQHIHLLYFGIKNDDVGKELARLLAEKAREGVEVRVLYDRLGSLFTPKKFFHELIASGGKVFTIRPFLLDINYRNHRKIVVIVGGAGYTGGMNIDRKYFGEHLRRKPWGYTHLRSKGGVVQTLQFIFLNDWVVAKKKVEEGVFSRLMNSFLNRKKPGTQGSRLWQVEPMMVRI